MIYLDTHVVVWLYAGLTDHLSSQAIDLIESNRLAISPMVQLELQYLQEIERINADSALIIESLGYSIGLEICQIPFIQVITESISQTWTRDPFDRLIVALVICLPLKRRYLLQNRELLSFSGKQYILPPDKGGSRGVGNWDLKQSQPQRKSIRIYCSNTLHRRICSHKVTESPRKVITVASTEHSESTEKIIIFFFFLKDLTIGLLCF